MNTTDNLWIAAHKGSFLREVQRLIAKSGRTPVDVAAAVGLPLAALTGAHDGLIRIPGPKLKQLALELGVTDAALLRTWLQEFQPWLVELLDELMSEDFVARQRSAISADREAA